MNTFLGEPPTDVSENDPQRDAEKNPVKPFKGPERNVNKPNKIPKSALHTTKEIQDGQKILANEPVKREVNKSASNKSHGEAKEKHSSERNVSATGQKSKAKDKGFSKERNEEDIC